MKRRILGLSETVEECAVRPFLMGFSWFVWIMPSTAGTPKPFYVISLSVLESTVNRSHPGYPKQTCLHFPLLALA